MPKPVSKKTVPQPVAKQAEGKQTAPKRWLNLVGVAVAITVVVLLISLLRPLPEEPQVAAEPIKPSIDFTTASRPMAVSTDGYVGSEQCQECHRHEHETWYNSFHRTMTQVASKKSIVGDFKDKLLVRGNQLYKLKTDGEQFWAEVENPHPKAAEALHARSKHPIVLTTGSHHMQVYWMLSGHGREVIDLPFVWMIDEQRWIPRESSFLVAPVVANAETFSSWNSSCMNCHTTHANRALEDPKTPQSTVAEFGISCEACHGPGQSHIASHRSTDTNTPKKPDPMVDPSRMVHDRSAQVCGQCHMAWHRETPGSDLTLRPGDELGKVRESVTNPYQFWRDGMVRIVGREFNGLQASKCYKLGELSCLNCHEMHPSKDDSRTLEEWNEDQLKVGMRGDTACLTCHEKYRGDANLTQHTHHPASSAGSRCYNCHMPNTTYGLLKATVSHQITSPSVKETLGAGRPNACNLCHLDKTLGWTDKALVQWYGRVPVDATEFKTDLAMSVDMAIQGDAAQRALMAWHLGWEPARTASKDDWMAPLLALLMTDDYPAVRSIAHRSLQNIGGYSDIRYDSEMSREQLEQARDAIIEKWTSQIVPTNRPELLLTPTTGWDHNAIRELLKRRDMTPVFLHE